LNFLQYKTPEELYNATGLTVQQALQIVEAELKFLRGDIDMSTAALVKRNESIGEKVDRVLKEKGLL